jgi:hypothetical protein
MENLEHILTHIEASAPCSLFSVAAWVETQLTMSRTGFIAALDTLVTSGAIELSSDDSGIVIDLI